MNKTISLRFLATAMLILSSQAAFTTNEQQPTETEDTQTPGAYSRLKDKNVVFTDPSPLSTPDTTVEDLDNYQTKLLHELENCGQKVITERDNLKSVAANAEFQANELTAGLQAVCKQLSFSSTKPSELARDVVPTRGMELDNDASKTPQRSSSSIEADESGDQSPSTPLATPRAATTMTEKLSQAIGCAREHYLITSTAVLALVTATYWAISSKNIDSDEDYELEAS